MKVRFYRLALPVLLPITCLLSSGAPAQVAAASPATRDAEAPAPKNVILFIGDGMGVSTVTATRIFDGQSRGQPGEENVLPFESFPSVALVKTYNTNQQVPDSAGTATAINSGVKTRAGAIGVGPAAPIGDCRLGLANRLPSIAEKAAAAGRAVGIVSTARLTHATPAAVYAHVPDRDWEADASIPVDQRGIGCTDIAAQLVAFPFYVALGGGREYFFGKARGGKRLEDAADLPAAWVRRRRGQYVETVAAMHGAVAGPGPLLGLLSASHMSFMRDRAAATTEPTLSEMTAAAIDKLSGKGEGYFLMVEGGRIDHGHHDGRAAYALSEAQELARAVGVALGKVDLSNTLVIVTADHSHVFTIAGYPTRGNPILGLAYGNDDKGDPTGRPILAADGKPYSTLGYQNGPGAVQGERPAPPTDILAPQQALIPTGDEFGGSATLQETHGGEDVPLYATGWQSASIGGVIEQNLIFDFILKALGVDD